MSRSFIHKTRWNFPKHLDGPLRNLHQAAIALKRASEHEFLKFTLDGRLIGDLGEALAEHFFEIKLCDSLKTGHDATMLKENSVLSVEVKTRMESTGIWFDSEPDFIIAFRIEKSFECLSLVYAGPGDVLRKIRKDAGRGSSMESPSGARITKFTSRQTVSLNQLAEHFDYGAFMASPTIPFKTRPVIHP